MSDEVFVPVSGVWILGGGNGSGKVVSAAGKFCKIEGKPGSGPVFVPLSVLEQQARNGTKTDRETATPPDPSATDAPGDAAKPLE